MIVKVICGIIFASLWLMPVSAFLITSVNSDIGGIDWVETEQVRAVSNNIQYDDNNEKDMPCCPEQIKSVGADLSEASSSAAYFCYSSSGTASSVDSEDYEQIQQNVEDNEDIISDTECSGGNNAESCVNSNDQPQSDSQSDTQSDYDKLLNLYDGDEPPYNPPPTTVPPPTTPPPSPPLPPTTPPPEESNGFTINKASSGSQSITKNPGTPASSPNIQPLQSVQDNNPTVTVNSGSWEPAN